MKWFEFFPFKAMKRFVITQIVFLALTTVAVVLSLRHFFSELGANEKGVLLFGRIDQFATTLGWLVFAMCVMYTLWASYAFFYPLGRLLDKAKNIKRGTYKKQWDTKVDPIQDFGEWYELELTLNKIHREMKKHKEDKKRREIEIETLAGAVSNGVIAVDTLKQVQFFNGPMAVILGEVFDPLSPPAYLDEVFRAPKLTLAVDEVIATRQPRRIQIPMRPHKMTENHVFDVLVTPVVHEKKNKFHGVIAVFHDITEARKVEEVRIDFVANASHELKTPLTAIKGYVDSLIQDFETQTFSNSKDKLKVIERNVNKLNELVVDLLALSRLDSSEDTVKEELSTEELTHDIVTELQRTWGDKHQNFRVDCQAPLVKGNRLMVDQVLTNLVENAIKYSPENAQIQIRWQCPSDQFVTLAVTDNGPGITEEHLSRLFERFYRVQNGKAQSGVTGTGLGLSIVKNSMLKMGGRIEVDSLPGRGTTFLCYFPRN